MEKKVSFQILRIVLLSSMREVYSYLGEVEFTKLGSQLDDGVHRVNRHFPHGTISVLLELDHVLLNHSPLNGRAGKREE